MQNILERLNKCPACKYFFNAEQGECRRFPPANYGGGKAKYPKVDQTTPICAEFRMSAIAKEFLEVYFNSNFFLDITIYFEYLKIFFAAGKEFLGNNQDQMLKEAKTWLENSINQRNEKIIDPHEIFQYQFIEFENGEINAKVCLPDILNYKKTKLQKVNIGKYEFIELKNPR